MSYELNKNDIYGFARSQGAEVKEKGKELFFRRCPYCHGGQHNDKDTFSINMENGTFKCFRATCGKQGHFVELCRDFDYALDFGKSSKEVVYRKLPQRPIQVRDNALAFLKSRGISETTGRRYNVTTQTNNQSIIVFPFYDENNVLQFVKYRNANYNGQGNKEWCEGKDQNGNGCKPILFGMAQCTDFSTLVVTEGQLDSLTLSECGIKNAVSVPNGAKGFTWLPNCYDWISKFKEIIVFGDWENGKMSLIDELNLKLPKAKIKSVQGKYYLGEKDANDIYRKFGKDAILQAVNNAIDVKTQCVATWNEIEDEDLTQREFVWTGIPTIDQTIGGLYLGQLVLLTGKSGHGKSTFASMLGCHALNQGFKCFFYSGELSKQQFKNWISLQLAGKNNVQEIKQTNRKNIYKPTEYAKKGIADFVQDKFYIYDNSYVADEMPDLLKVVEEMICRYGVKYICLDNLMTAMQDVSANEVYNKQSQFARKLKKIADTYNVLIILVAHPRKSQNNGFSNDDILGSSEVVNRADLVISYSKATKEGADYSSEVIISKNRLTSDLIYSNNSVKLCYSSITKRVLEKNCNDIKFNWERFAQAPLQPQEPEDPPF